MGAGMRRALVLSVLVVLVVASPASAKVTRAERKTCQAWQYWRDAVDSNGGDQLDARPEAADVVKAARKTDNRRLRVLALRFRSAYNTSVAAIGDPSVTVEESKAATAAMVAAARAVYDECVKLGIFEP